MVDTHSQRVEAFMMGSASSVTFITKIDSIFTHVELPEVLVMNNSSVFKNAEFEAFVNLKWDPLPLKHPTIKPSIG